MKTDLTFKIFCELVKKVIHFENEWDVNEWNYQYRNFKENLMYYSTEYVVKTETDVIVMEWAKEFYQDATPDSHSYWVKTN